MYVSQPVYPGVGNKQITNKRFDLVTNRAHICHGYHGLYPWRKNCHMEKFWEILVHFVVRFPDPLADGLF